MFGLDSRVDVLSPEECRQLLGGEVVGRIALSVGALPHVVPVFYHVEGDTVLVELGMDANLYAALTDNVVAFEIDHVEPDTPEGWTVMVVGRSVPAQWLESERDVADEPKEGPGPDSAEHVQSPHPPVEPAGVEEHRTGACRRRQGQAAAGGLEAARPVWPRRQRSGVIGIKLERLSGLRTTAPVTG